MSTCPNCKKKLSCGCQKRKASNGREVCSNCLTSYEEQLKNKSSNTNEVVKDEYNNLKKFTNTLDIT